MYQNVSSTHTGPIIEEVFDSPRRNQLPFRDVTHNESFRMNERRMNGSGVMDSETFNRVVNDPVARRSVHTMKKLIEYVDYQLERSRNMEDRDGSTEESRIIIDRLQNSRTRMAYELMNLESHRSFERREQSRIEEPRLRRLTQEADITERENEDRTRLHHSNSYHRKQASSSNRREDSSDEEDDEEDRRAQAHRQRFSRDYHHSHQNERSHATMNSTMSRYHNLSRPKANETSSSSNRGASSSNRGVLSLDPPRLVRGKNTVSKSKVRRYRPGAKALMEIRKYQRSTDTLIAKAPFRRLIVEIIRDVGGDEFRVQGTAVEALQEIAEAFLVDLFEKSSLLSHHAKRVTLMPSDIQLYKRLCTKY